MPHKQFSFYAYGILKLKHVNHVYTRLKPRGARMTYAPQGNFHAARKAQTAVTMANVQAFYENDENLKKLGNFLRSKEGPPVREALLREKRVNYLKGTLSG